MTAKPTTSSTVEIADSDPAWEAFFRITKDDQEIVIQTLGGKSFTITPRKRVQWQAGEINRAELPDFEARLRKLWPAGTELSQSQSAQLDAWLSDDRPL